MNPAILFGLLVGLFYFSFLLGVAVATRRANRLYRNRMEKHKAKIEKEEMREQINHTLGLAFGRGVKAYVDGKEKVDFNHLDEHTRVVATQWYQIGIQYARGMEKGGAYWRKDTEE